MKPIDRQLIDAAKVGDDKKIIELLNKGADVNAQDPGYYLYTPLHWAAGHGYLSAVNILLMHGANLNAQALCGHGTPLNVAHSDPNNTAVRELLTNVQINLNWQLIEAAKIDDYKKIIELLKKGADVNGKDLCYYHYTPLHWAAGHANLLAVTTLLANGANPNAQDCRGYSCLDIANANPQSKAAVIPCLQAVGGHAIQMELELQKAMQLQLSQQHQAQKKKKKHGFKKLSHKGKHALKNVFHETGKAASSVGHVVEHGVKDVGYGLEHGGREVAKSGERIVNAPQKLVHSIVKPIVKHKVSKAFEKKMLEAINNVENELGERKAQDRIIIEKTIAEKIKQLAETYKDLTSQNTLQEGELELIDMLRMIIAAIHDCRYGFKDSVEDILKLDLNDYRVVEFLKKRPLILTLQNFATHQNPEALSILLPYFNKNLNQLSAENKADYLFLKGYVANKVEKEETELYFAKMVQLIETNAKTGILKVSNNNIIAEVKTSTTANLLAQLNPNGVVSMNVTPDIEVTANPVATMSAQPPVMNLTSENHVAPEEINRNVCRM